MFKRSDDKITASQATIFLTNTVLGAGILTMPRSVTQAMESPDSWITILIGGFAIMPVILLMVRLCLKFQGQTIFEFAGKIVGKWPGKILCLLLILYFIIIAGFEIRTLAEVGLFFLLEGTPIWAIVLPFIWAGTYLVSGGINSIARVYQIVFPITILFLIVSYGFSLRIFDIGNLRPVMGEGIMPLLKGLKSSILIYTGCEVVMIIVAFMEDPKQATKAMLGGIAIPFGLYFLTIIVVVGGLSVNAVITSTWPTFDLIRSFEITGFFVERLEFPLMVIWLMQMFCNFCSFFFQASLGVSQLFKTSFQSMIFIMVPLVFLSTMVPKSRQDLFALGDAIGTMGVWLFFLTTVLLSLVWWIRVKGLKQHV